MLRFRNIRQSLKYLSIAFFLFFSSSDSIGQIYQKIVNNSKTRNFRELVKKIEDYYQDKDKGKGSGYKQFKRWEEFHRHRLDRQGNLVNISQLEYDELKKFNKTDKSSSARTAASGAAGNWVSMGALDHKSQTSNGRINAIAVDPENANVIYAGSPSGGLWRSMDDGKTWNCLTDNIASTVGISGVLLDPVSPAENRTIYILTGDKDASDIGFIGLFKSVDNGNSWTRLGFNAVESGSATSSGTPSGDAINSGMGHIVTGDHYKLMMHPVDNKMLFFLTSQGIYKSLDAGQSWKIILEADLNDLEFNPASPSILYASGIGGTYRSANTGTNWLKVAHTIPVSSRNELAVTPANPSLVYLLLGQPDVAALYKSSDSGLTFAKVPTGFDFFDMTAWQYNYDLALAVSPVNAQKIYMAGITFHKSLDGGLKWIRQDMGHFDYHYLGFHHNYLYAGNDGGITRRDFSYPDGSPGENVQDLSDGFSVAQIYRIGVSSSDPTHLLAGTQDNGTLSIKDGFGAMLTGADGMDCFFDPVIPKMWYSTTQSGGLWRGDDYTPTDYPQYTNINPPGTSNGGSWVTPFLMDPVSPGVLYAGFRDLWKNPSRGDAAWINLTYGSVGGSNNDVAAIKEITVAASNPDFIYFHKYWQNVLYKTADGGKTWTVMTCPENVTRIVVHPEDPNVLWITIGGFVAGSKIYKSSDGGATWINVSGSLPNVPAHSLVYQHNSPNGIYVGTDLGVFYFDDTMNDWIKFDGGMPFAIITDLEINHAAGKIYAGTYGRGAWVSDLYKTDNFCNGTGTIQRELWSGISGTLISSIPVNSPPSSVSDLETFECPSNTDDNYGSRVRGYICAPSAGNYTFWISSNDKSELWLSTDENPANKRKIASVGGYTNTREWTKYSSQKSSPVTLMANVKYYIEALHKEGVGSDHLAVGWQLPDGSFERPIPGVRLLPYAVSGNSNPVVSITSPESGQRFSAPASVNITATASDSDGSITKVEFYNGTMKLTEDTTLPYTFTWTDVSEGSYTIVAKAIDNNGASSTFSIDIIVTVSEGCTESGKIQHDVWTGISGTLISSIPQEKSPSSTSELTIFEAPSNIGDNYGSRIRGFICVPESGIYTFWISSNDKSELWLSTDENNANKKKIGFVGGYTNVRGWTKYSSQQSSPIGLVANKKYYIEALHKEGIGADHLAVGWQLPDGTMERPIPGNRLSPFADGTNKPPAITIANPAEGQTFDAPASINVEAYATDDGTIIKVEFFEGPDKLGEDLTTPYTFTWSNVAAGTYSLTAKATDDAGATTTSPVMNIKVNAGCTASGTITRDYWGGIQGNSVSDIPLHIAPASTNELAIFEGPANIGSNYATRIAGYICAPATGSYIFWIASNDHSELLISSDDNPANKEKIAYITGATTSRQWDKFTSQRSRSINLFAGKRYYIEALHKQGTGSDNIAVGWQLPDGTLERPIPGNRLSPLKNIPPPSALPQFVSNDYLLIEGDHEIEVFPNPVGQGMVTLTIGSYEHFSEITEAMIEIKSVTGQTIYSHKTLCEAVCNSVSIHIGKEFKPGIYMMTAVINRKRFLKRLLVY